MNSGRKLAQLAPAFVLLLLTPGQSVAAGPPDTAMACIECHGQAGVSKEPDIPTIAGMSDFYLGNQLVLFREQARPCVAGEFSEHEHGSNAEDHCAIAKALSEERATEIAGYFSAKSFAAAEQAFDAGKAERGARIHELRCARCHADSGSDPFDDAGILAGQWTAYLSKTIQDFRSGDRWQPDAKASAMDALDDDAVEALVHHYAAAGAD